MAAIVRIKRRRDEDPVESLMISCKKARHTASNEEVTQTVFKFAGTLSSEDSNDVSRHIRTAIRKDKLAKEYLQHSGTGTAPSVTRTNSSKISQTSTFRVIAQKRALDLDSLATAEEPSDKKDKPDNESKDGQDCVSNNKGAANTDKVYCLFDVESEGAGNDVVHHSEETQQVNPPETVTCNGVAMIREHVPVLSSPAVPHQSHSDFVYDLYYMNRQDFDFRSFEDILHIEAMKDDLFYGDYRCGAVEEVCDDDEDSNDEGNWRNDYPDEDEWRQDDEPESYDQSSDTDANDIAERLGIHFNLGVDRHAGGVLSSDEEDCNVYSDHAYAFGAPRSFEEYKNEVEEDLSDSDVEAKPSGSNTSQSTKNKETIY